MTRNARAKPISLAEFPGGTPPRKCRNKPKKCPKMGFAAFRSATAQVAEREKRTQFQDTPQMAIWNDDRTNDDRTDENRINKPANCPKMGLAPFRSASADVPE